MIVILDILFLQRFFFAQLKKIETTGHKLNLVCMDSAVLFVCASFDEHF